MDVKVLCKDKSDDDLNALMSLYGFRNGIEANKEILSAIGRQNEHDKTFDFIETQAFNDKNSMELIYQMYRICLQRGKDDDRFVELADKIKRVYKNENIDKMKLYFDYRQRGIKRMKKQLIKQPLLLVGDTEETLNSVPEQSVQLVFTSPPYYNAREYSDYHSYAEYLGKMKRIFVECSRIIEDGRFIIVNVSPVITKRAGREFESIRYPIHYDFHTLLNEAGFYFIDEIIWIKPEPSVPNRIGGYLRNRKPLSYKPNCITESLMVYRKKCGFLLDKNIKDYGNDYEKFEKEKIDTTNCWYIAPKYDKNHPAVFPDELCRRVLKYYSFQNDVVLDPFAGSGTLGRIAKKMNRIPIMCEINEEYAALIENSQSGYYKLHK